MIEDFHRQLHKPTKSKSAFPSDESLLKMLYLVTLEVLDITKQALNGPINELKERNLVAVETNPADKMSRATIKEVNVSI